MALFSSLRREMRTLFQFLLVLLITLSAQQAFAFGKHKPKPKPSPSPSPSVVPRCAFDVEVFDGAPAQGQHVVGAQVRVGSLTATAGSNGVASFTLPARGHYLIQVDAAGYDHYE